jgi:4-hydroxy-4-methyl-2-oxoglutarate aldolase
VGYAVTVTADSTTPGRTRSRQGHVKVYDALAASPKPAVLVVQDVGSKRTHACFMGDVIATLAHRLGAIGIVTDGGVRDLDGVRPLAFHVFAAGLVVAHGTFNFIEAGVPVELSGVRVQPGDLIHGDASGVTTIPLQTADKVYGECLRLREREAALRDYAHSRDFSLEGLKAKLLGK